MKIRIVVFLGLLTACLFAYCVSCSGQENVIVNSPDGNVRLEFVSFGNGNALAEFTIACKGRQVLHPSAVGISSPSVDLSSGFQRGQVVKSSHSSSWINSFGARRIIPDKHNQLIIPLTHATCKINIVCRVYNEGVALCWEFPAQNGLDSLIISDEKIQFRFPSDYPAWSAPNAQALYTKVPVSKIDKGCERPLVIEYDSTLTVALAEAKLVDFARMKLEPDTTGGIAIRSILDGEVRKKLPFQSPWRVVMIGESPGDLLEKNYLLMNLNDPSAIRDESWIKPGKVVREITLTTKGARALVDFAAAHRLQYIEFDAGWYGHEYDDSSDARGVHVDPRRSKGPLDLQSIISYAQSKDIGVLLYVNRRALERQLDEILPLYSAWGISGLKFGFVQVGTQPVTAWMHEAIRKASDFKMVVDVHDEYRPTGFSRTYPNFLTQEGVRGDEESPTNGHTLITMFTRALAGAADNTVCYYDARVDAKMGSHASQLAKAVCILSPLQFLYWYDKTIPEGMEHELPGKPNYLGDEPELEFFDNVPTTWDETKVLHGKIGQYGVVARKKGSEWFIGGINNEVARDLNIGMSFLDRDRKYTASIYTDDPEVASRTRVKIDRVEVDNKTAYVARLGKNKGIAFHLKPN